MSAFSDTELAYLHGERRLSRIANAVRGRAEAIEVPQPMTRIHPERVFSWGLRAANDAESSGVRTA